MTKEKMYRNYFNNKTKPYTVTVGDFDGILDLVHDNRQIMLKLMARDFPLLDSWETDLRNLKAYIHMFTDSHGEITLSRNQIETLLSYVEENRLIIEAGIGLLESEKERIKLKGFWSKLKWLFQR